MKNIAARVALATLATLSLGSAQAYVTFLGEDLNGDPNTPLASTPNASAAEFSFLSLLTGVGIETFETQTVGATAPLALTFPGTGSNLTATLDGGNGVVSEVTAGSTDGNGRYSVPSATSTRFWEVIASDGSGSSGIADFTVTFSRDISAFGFWGIDIGDFGGTLSLQLRDAASNVLTTLSIGNSTTGDADGSVLFFGARAASSAEVFRSVVFLTSAGAEPDAFGFDRFTIADACQAGTSGVDCNSNGVPEPATLALLGLGLAGLATSRRRKG